MATVASIAPLTLPVSGADMDAEPITNEFTNILAFLNEASNMDEGNVDLTSNDGIVGKSTAQTIAGNKTFSGTTAFTGTVTGISGFTDTLVDASGGGSYTTIQAADDALDSAAGYRIRVVGSQTYNETVTVTTNDNIIWVDQLTVIASMVLSGHRNTVILGASCKFTGNITLSGNHNKVVFDQLANLDGNVTLSGTGCEIHLGAGANLATGKTLLLSGANSKAIVGAEFTCPGILSMTADDTYMEIGNQSTITGATGLITGTGQVLKAGNEVTFTGAVTQSAVDSELHAGSTATFTGAFTQSGARSVLVTGVTGLFSSTFTQSGANSVSTIGANTQIVAAVVVSGAEAETNIGSIANFDADFTISGVAAKVAIGATMNLATTKTLLLSGANASCIIGPQAAFLGIVSMTADDTYMEFGNQSKITGAQSMATGSGQVLVYGNECWTVGNTTLNAIEGEIRYGSTANIDGTVVIGTGRGSKFITGNNAGLAQTLTVTGDVATIDLGTDTQVVGNILISHDSVDFRAGARWDFDGTFDVDADGDQCRVWLGTGGNLAGAFDCTADDGDVYIGPLSTMVGAVTIDNRSRVEFGAGCSLSTTLGIAGGTNADVVFRANCTVTGIITMSSTESRLEFGPGCNIVAALNASGTDSAIRAGAKTDFGGIVTLSGVGASMICENGCDLDGLVTTGANVYFNGGGWDTHIDGTTANIAINVLAGADFFIENVQASNNQGGSAGNAVSFDNTANGGTLRNVYVSSSDGRGISVAATRTDVSIIDVKIDLTDVQGIYADGARLRISGVRLGTGIGGDNIYMDSNGDNSIAWGNHSQDTGNFIVIPSGSNHSNVSLNIGNGAVSDSGTGSVVDGTNKEY